MSAVLQSLRTVKPLLGAVASSLTMVAGGCLTVYLLDCLLEKTTIDKACLEDVKAVLKLPLFFIGFVTFGLGVNILLRIRSVRRLLGLSQ